tara:strand:+ start:3333 stop:3551 length:219 start_codon:yes stop_codon:yes gene_type:complete
VKAGDLVYDEAEGKCALVMSESNAFPLTHWREKLKPLYLYYTDGAIHEVWWHTYTPAHRERIKVLNSTENEE